MLSEGESKAKNEDGLVDEQSRLIEQKRQADSVRLSCHMLCYKDDKVFQSWFVDIHRLLPYKSFIKVYKYRSLVLK